MFNKFNIIFFLTFFIQTLVMAKEISLQVVSIPKPENTKESIDQSLKLNGFRQAVSAELLELKLDSNVFWLKLGMKKMSPQDEFNYLNGFFENVSVAVSKPASNKKASKETPQKVVGNFKASIDSEKLKNSYVELFGNVNTATQKSFFILADIGIDKSMNWEDVGVTKPENFSGVIKDSWKKLFEKDFKGFERIEILEKDLAATNKETLNPKSVTLKWNSLLKKVSSNEETGATSFELTAQYVLQNTKSGTVLVAFDFPIQKRDLNSKNKKALSSALASLEYNLLLSQSTKIREILASTESAAEQSEIEVKLITKSGLSEIYQINDLLQKKFSDHKLTSSMKSYSTDGSTILIRAEGTPEAIINLLSIDGGKISLNEQKILLFNRDDKTFAILSKESNN